MELHKTTSTEQVGYKRYLEMNGARPVKKKKLSKRLMFKSEHLRNFEGNFQLFNGNYITRLV